MLPWIRACHEDRGGWVVRSILFFFIAHNFIIRNHVISAFPLFRNLSRSHSLSGSHSSHSLLYHKWHILLEGPPLLAFHLRSYIMYILKLAKSKCVINNALSLRGCNWSNFAFQPSIPIPPLIQKANKWPTPCPFELILQHYPYIILNPIFIQ